MNENKYLHTLKVLFKEEYRFQTDLFGGLRFLTFPLIISGLVGLALVLLVDVFETTTVGGVLLGIHVLGTIHGLQTSSLAFASKDEIKGMFDSNTSIIEHSYSLPTSVKSHVLLFLLKDLIFYAVLFYIPLSLMLVAISSTPLIVFISLPLTFLFGLSVGLFLLSIFGSVIIVGGAVLTVLTLWAFNISWVLSLTPLFLYSDPSVISSIAPILTTALFVVLGVFTYSPNTDLSTKKVGPSALPVRESKFSYELRNQLLYVLRSNGGIWKILFSTGIVCLVGLYSYTLVTEFIPEPNFPIFLAVLLSIIHFTTYSWINQSDSTETYTSLPVEYKTVEKAKRFTFYLLSTGVSAVFYVPLVIFYGGDIISVVISMALFGALIWFYYRITYFFSGHSPFEFLFDSVSFSAYSMVFILFYVPLIIISIFNLPVIYFAPVIFVAIIAGYICQKYGIARHTFE